MPRPGFFRSGPAPVGLHDLANDGQAQAGAVAAALVRNAEELLEDMRQVLGGMPTPVSATVRRTTRIVQARPTA